MSFSPEEIGAEIQKHIPDFVLEYASDYRQQIADSWPKSIDDSNARADWGWKPEYDLAKMTKDMFQNI
jgi:nucleoside-diphosphate-sugar epimerase